MFRRIQLSNITGYGRRPFHNRCHFLRDESTESSTDDSEKCQPHYHCSIPRLIITLDRENNQLQDDMSPDTPGCPLELKCGPAQPRPIPVFAFTCEDFDELHPSSDTTTHDSNITQEEEKPPPVPEPPNNYDQSSENNEAICLPPQMKPIDTKLTLDLFNIRKSKDSFYRRRCTGVDECVSACECCRTPQPDSHLIPFIDEPNCEPVIIENDIVLNKVATPKTRQILPSLSIDKSEEVKPETADAICQTPSSPMDVNVKVISTPPTLLSKNLELNLDIKSESRRIENMCRLKRTLFSMSKSFSKSEETEIPSTYSTSDSFDNTINEKKLGRNVAYTPLDGGARQVLDSVDRKSWKSPDEYRPAFGKVKALTQHFNDINLTYCVKNYKRNCQSSPNLSSRDDDKLKICENLPSSASLADIHYESKKTDSSETKGKKMSDEEVKSIIIQLEDWSRYGSRGSEDTLAQGNEFELPNLPSEDYTDNNGFVFNEIIDKKPKKITLDNIKLRSNQSSVNSEIKLSKESLVGSGSLEKFDGLRVLGVVAMVPQKHASSLLNISPPVNTESGRQSYVNVVQSCPNISVGSVRGRLACAACQPRYSCPAIVARPPSAHNTSCKTHHYA